MVKKVWSFLNGKKTKIAGFIMLIYLKILPMWFPDGIPIIVKNSFETTIEICLYVGLGHTAYKKYRKKEGK